MTIEHTEVLWLESRSDYSIDELMQMSGLPRASIEELLDCGALPEGAATTIVQRQASVCFTSESVTLARAANRLRRHFELDDNALAVAVTLLRRVRELETRLAAERAGR